MKPSFPWYGGKKNVKDEIVKKLKTVLKVPSQTYYEPFVGGGTILLELMPKRVLVSDINCYLINLYNVMKYELDSLIIKLDKIEDLEAKNSKLFFENNKEIFNKKRKLVKFGGKFTKSVTKEQIEMAARFYYMCKRGFGGIINVRADGYVDARYAQT